MNRVILMGRLTRDPEIRYSQGERSMTIAKYTLAGVLVSGRLQTGSYVNKEGHKVYTADVILDDQEFADSRNVSSDTGSGYTQAAPSQRQAPVGAIGDGFMNIPDGVEDEGLPFN